MIDEIHAILFSNLAAWRTAKNSRMLFAFSTLNVMIEQDAGLFIVKPKKFSYNQLQFKTTKQNLMGHFFLFIYADIPFQ